MQSFALLIDGAFQYIRDLPERPPDIPQKSVTWHDVVRREGEAEFNGLEDGMWVVQSAAPVAPPPFVPEFITRRQCALELHARQIITLQEALYMTKSGDVPLAIKSIFARMPDGERVMAEIDFAATNYYRNNFLLGRMGLTDPQIDEFFIAAAQL